MKYFFNQLLSVNSTLIVQRFGKLTGKYLKFGSYKWVLYAANCILSSLEKLAYLPFFEKKSSL